jgi:hypothetical protein
MAGLAYMTGRKQYQRPQGIMFSENSGTLVSGTYVPLGQEVNSIASITAVNDAYPSSGTVEYTANNTFQVGDVVIISGLSISGFNGQFTVTAATSTYFRVTNTTTGTPTLTNAKATAVGEFLILSDDNRSGIDVKPMRIESRRRMVNGRMRSYHIADKLQISTSWQLLPSRSFSNSPDFNYSTGEASTTGYAGLKDTIGPSSGTFLYQYTSDGGAGGVDLLDWYENHKGSFWVYLAYDKFNNFDAVTGVTDKYANLGKYNQIVEMFISDFSYTVERRGGTNHDLWNISITLEEV